MTPRIVRHRWDEVPLDKVTEMVASKTLGGTDLEVTQAYFKKGTRVPGHAHDGEVLLYVLQGVLHLVGAGLALTLREGDLAVVPAGARHEAEVLDDAFVLMLQSRRH